MYYSLFLCKFPLRLVVLYYCTMFIVSFSAYSAPLCNFIFKNRSNAMRTLLIFSLSLPSKNRLQWLSGFIASIWSKRFFIFFMAFWRFGILALLNLN